VLNAMGVSYDYIKEFDKASRCYEAALRLDPESANVYFNNMGQSLFEQGKYDQAIEVFKKAASYDEDYPDSRIHNNLGRAYTMIKRYDLAMTEFEKGSGKASAESVLNRVLDIAGENFSGTDKVASVREDEIKEFEEMVKKFNRNSHVNEKQLLATGTVDVAAVDKPKPLPVTFANIGPVSHEKTKTLPASGNADLSKVDENKAFSARVSDFLQNRNIAKNNIHNEYVASVESQKAQKASGAANVCVEVLNGNGVKLSASNMRDSLIRQGFRVTRVSDGINVMKTYIYYATAYDDAAKMLDKEIPVDVTLKEVASLEVLRIKLRLLLGKNMVNHTRTPLQNPSTLNSWIGA
jgi:tetratricopeptide (TPR) repeat protein